MNTETVTATPVPGARRRVWIYTVVAAVALPMILWTIVDPLLGHKLVADAGGQAMRITQQWVISGSMVPAMVGLGISMVVRRYTKRPRLIWLIVSITALVLSLGSPLGGTNATTVLVLMSMHLLVGVSVVIGGLKLTSS